MPEWSLKYLGYEIKVNQINAIDELEDAFCYASKEYLNNYEDKKVTNDKRKFFLKGFLTACDHLSSASETEIIYAVSNINEILNFKEYRSIQERLCLQRIAYFNSITGYGKRKHHFCGVIIKIMLKENECFIFYLYNKYKYHV